MADFYDKCYKLLQQVPRGKITTYRALAHALNSKAYRAVGTAMNKNPHAPRVPCHRVINSDGKLGGYAKGRTKKKHILKKEGISVQNGKVVDFKKYLFEQFK